MPALTSFRRIEHMFALIKENRDEQVGWKPIVIWFVGRKNGLREWVNEHELNDEGKMLPINTYQELKEKIQKKLSQMRYADVSEIPDDIEITYAD